MKSLGTCIGLVIFFASMAYAASGEMISGTVKGPSSAPCKGAFVRLRSATNNKITISVLSDKQGHYPVYSSEGERVNIFPRFNRVRVTSERERMQRFNILKILNP